MTATFVPRRHADGTLRIDLTITHSLGAEDLVKVLASAHRATSPGELPMLRYTDAVAVLRRELRCDAPFLWREAFNDRSQHADALETWAAGEVSRIFPALSPA
ncbi:hypothetical protein ACIBUR_38835 [Streptomyces anulatus]